MVVKILNNSENKYPDYQTELSAGVDLMANLNNEITLLPMSRVLIPTGISIELPVGFEAQVRPRSGLAIKHGITVLNAPGTIDADYRGEIGVVLINLSKDKFYIKNGDRIAQMVFCKYYKAIWDKVDSLSATGRGGDGFGSTGL